MYKRLILMVVAGAMCVTISCRKDRTKPVPVHPVSNSIYGDSVLFVQPSVSHYIVSPVNLKDGTYSVIPDGLKIDPATGSIDVNQSETGLKYKVLFTPTGSNIAETSYIIISGINYQDKIYNLATGDSIAMPIYNANIHATLPGINNGSSFDNNSGCKNAGIEVDPNTAEINLAKSVRDQGIDTGSTQEVKLVYKINDDSHQATNGLDVKVYFYRTASEIPQYLLDILNARKGLIFDSAPPAPLQIQTIRAKTLASITFSSQQPARPRPPCIIVVSR
ncbi:MAG TPA: hypothetical protein VFE54_13775 [Mucilaginibacter sp.]|nr:hypothetical protein [Mucilaginibacter sp.]